MSILNIYDGFIVKELKASNTLDKDRTSKQTHIAITGAQMDFFPSIRANGYFDASYQTQDDGLKKYFVLEVPVIMHKKNIEYLGGTAEQDKEKVFVSIVRSKRNDATDQIQMSMTYLDSPNFIKFRRLCHEGSFLIVLKQKERLLYDVFAIKKEDVSESLRELNNKFIKDSTNTRVYLENIIVPDNSAPSSNIVGFNKIYYGILNNVDLTYAEKAKDNVGISFSNDRVELVVPKFFRIEKDEHVLKTNILLFLESISIAKKINYKNSSNTKENDNGWPIESYVWLIHDYLENGFYYKRETVYSKDLNGKINWKRTLKNTPIISDGNIIYDKLITSKNSPSNDVITHIYKICLRESLEKVGWLFNYGFKILEFPLISSEEMVYRVKSEMASTFDDVKRIRFKHMLNILEKVDDKAIKKDKFQYQINNYYYVFEQMIDSIFNGLSGKEKKRYNPTGHWMLLGEDDPKKASI